MKKDIWVLMEPGQADGYRESSLALLHPCRALADTLGGTLTAVALFGGDVAKGAASGPAPLSGGAFCATSCARCAARRSVRFVPVFINRDRFPALCPPRSAVSLPHRAIPPACGFSDCCEILRRMESIWKTRIS